MFIIFYFDKIYCIFNNHGNDRFYYIKFFNYQKCAIHQIYTCGCKTNLKTNIDNDDRALIDNYFTAINNILNIKNIIKGRL